MNLKVWVWKVTGHVNEALIKMASLYVPYLCHSIDIALQVVIQNRFYFVSIFYSELFEYIYLKALSQFVHLSKFIDTLFVYIFLLIDQGR